ncbi:hypothetical protein EA462_15710 [Natrarchaeobius halalkaliphilus]|uniref:Uncharacterized protein n=1 Tax=Natrarchaeobius halalkaliphilus TaxID=1679091 RepID=A0A3N6M4I9_9EURY|nr:hypothetical protein [Natrarchaeobius halalkaliphilus]RQG87077.1 hypothetical protein EA462_15710 [Natrarchaeobius halalkaliphilus]
MTEWNRIRAIARTELRRTSRAIQQDAGQMIAFGFLALFLVPFSLSGLVGAYVFGEQIASGGLETPLHWGRLVLVYGWLFVAVFSGYRAYSSALRPDRLDGLLTTVSHRDLLGGIVLSEVLLWGLATVLYGVAASLAFAAGLRSIVAAPLALLAICLAVFTAFATGFLVALVVRNAGVRSPRLARLRTVAFLLAAIAYVALIYTQNVTAALDPVFWLLEPTPIGWYGDLALLGGASEASPARGVGVLVASVLFLLASARVLSTLAEWLWYADGAHAEVDAASTSASTTDGSRLERYLPRSVAGVVLADWKRARRAPITLSFVLYPLIVLINPIFSVIQTGTIGSSFPLWIVLTVGWVAGVLFTLNVLGNEGAVLPSTVLTAGPERALVVGHVLAGTLLVAPIAVILTAGLTLLSPRPLTSVLTLTVSSFVLVVAAASIATGIGAVFPRYEEINVSRSTKAIVPSTIAFGIYSVVIALVALPTLVGHSSVVGHVIESAFGTSQLSLALGGTIGTVLLAAPVGLLSMRYAIRSVERFHLE